MQTPPPPTPTEFSRPLLPLLNARWPENRTFTIVCHGHSVPAGYFKTPEVCPFDAYPHLLHRAINRRFPHAVTNVIVTAIGGEDSVRGAARFERDVLSLRPDVLTIDYALNDRRAGLKAAETAWREMVGAATKVGIRVILLTPTWDLAVSVDNTADPLFQHAEQIRRLAREYRTGLADSLAGFLAAHRAGTSLETLMSQGNHPNRAGHEIALAALTPWFGANSAS